MAIMLWLGFLITGVIRAAGGLVHPDLRLVARLLPVSEHQRLLRVLHPLVHLGDAVFVVPVTLLLAALLWAMGYGRVWVLPLLALLSWPLEVGCKALLPQPNELGTIQENLSLDNIVQGRQAASILGWLRHAAPGGVDTLMRHAGGASIGLSSSFPSGTTARGAFVLGLLIWICWQLAIPVLAESLAVLLALPLAVLGVATVLFAWHWPSDVLGGYLLGLALLATALTMLQRPRSPQSTRTVRSTGCQDGGPHSPHSPLPWIVHR